MTDERTGTRRMHADEADIDEALVRRLLLTQFPQWADLPLEPVPSAGTDNAIYRLGRDLAVRLPRIQETTAQVAKEQKWLPRLAPHLPLAIPVPVARGTPAEGYPWHWSVYRWLEGENATVEPVADLRRTATKLANFVVAMQRIDSTDGPGFGKQNFGRGEPLAMRDAATREAIVSIQEEIDAAAVTAAWEAALQAPTWDEPPTLIHGDLSPLNLLVVDGELTAVIDFGCLGVGDPACETMVAWTLFKGESRDAYRERLGVDHATWARGRGWALSVGLLAIPYYKETNPVLADLGRHAIAEVLADR